MTTPAIVTRTAGTALWKSWKNSSQPSDTEAAKEAVNRQHNWRSHMPWSHGQFHWNELMTRNVEKAKKFYADTIGWTYDAMQMPEGGTYTLAMSGDMPVAGIFDISGA